MSFDGHRKTTWISCPGSPSPIACILILQRGDGRSLVRELRRIQERHGFAFSRLTDPRGHRLFEPNAQSVSPAALFERATLGEPAVGIEILKAEDLACEAPAIAERIKLRLVPTPRAGATLRQVEERAMVIHALGDSPGITQLRSRDWEGKGVVIAVSDTGPGIPDALRDKVFTPFFTTKDVGAGAGLGLSISYGLIRRYGGNITLESEAGQGTEICVWLLSEPEISDDVALGERL